MKTFILIHGSWHSAWNWYKVKSILEQNGYEVFTPDLLGMGRDKTSIEDATLDKNVAYLCNLIDSIKNQVILLAHSKNGIIISQVAEYRANKIDRLIYLAAYLIPDGKCQYDYASLDIHSVLWPYIAIAPDRKSHFLRPEIYKEGLYHDCEDEIFEMAKLILSNENAVSAFSHLKLTDSQYGSLRKFYIECTEDKAVTPFIQEKMLEDTYCEKIYKIKTSHSPFFSKAKELCDILIEIANL